MTRMIAWLVHLVVSVLTIRVSDPAGGVSVKPRLLYRWGLLGAWWAWHARRVFVSAILGLLLAGGVAWIVGRLR